MKFTVDRKTWYRGRNGTDSRLLCEDGMRCCIGFVAKQCGVTDEDILNKPYAYSLKTEAELKFPAWMWHDASLQEAYRINDATDLSDVTREARLKEIFGSQGDEIEFVD